MDVTIPNVQLHQVNALREQLGLAPLTAWTPKPLTVHGLTAGQAADLTMFAGADVPSAGNGSDPVAP